MDVVTTSMQRRSNVVCQLKAVHLNQLPWGYNAKERKTTLGVFRNLLLNLWFGHCEPMTRSIIVFCIVYVVILDLLPSRQNYRKGRVKECIFYYMALCIECRFNKNALLQCCFVLEISKAYWVYTIFIHTKS